MLPYTLVLLLATSTLALPTVDIIPYYINDLPSIPDNGRLVNKFIVNGALEVFDTGDLSVYENDLLDFINSLAGKSGDAASQASTLLLTVSVLGEVGNVVPGDACEAAAVINAFASGNKAKLATAVANYVQRVARYIDTIVDLAVNSDKIRYSAGPKGTCYAGGRSYDFDGVWNKIIDSANNPSQLQEEYCSTKRLYTALSSRSNNVAAAVTASAIPPVRRLAEKAREPLAQFLRAIASGGNAVQAGANAKSALKRAL